MVNYNPKDWFTFIFRFHKADTFRKLTPLLIAICIYSGIIAYLELEYWQLSERSFVKNIPVMHTMLGFAISMLLVFRTNTAYDRWWEARKFWGQLVNSSRSLSIKLKALLEEKAPQELPFFEALIPAFAQALHEHLHRFPYNEEEYKKLSGLSNLDFKGHVPNQITLVIFKKVVELKAKGLLSQDEVRLINNELTSLTDITGACERIKNTPIPYSYSAFIKKFIFTYIMTLPFGYVFQLGYYVIPVVAFVLYVLASLEIIAEEIEDPFGDDDNDIPTELLAANIRKNVVEIFSK